MPASTVIKHWKDGKVTLSDGTAVPVTLVVPFALGDFKLSGLSADMTDTKVYKVRGVKQTIRKGESLEPSGSFSAYIADYSDATNQTVLDYVRKAGAYSTNVSTISTSTTPNGDVYAVDIAWAIEGTDLGDSTDHSVTCTKCVVTMDLQEGEPNQVSFSFTCYGTVTLV